MVLNRWRFSPLALFAFRHNRRVETVAKRTWQLVQLVPLVDLNRLARCAVGYNAMLTFAKMLLEIGPHRPRNLFIEQFV